MANNNDGEGGSGKTKRKSVSLVVSIDVRREWVKKLLACLPKVSDVVNKMKAEENSIAKTANSEADYMLKMENVLSEMQETYGSNQDTQTSDPVPGPSSSTSSSASAIELDEPSNSGQPNEENSSSGEMSPAADSAESSVSSSSSAPHSSYRMLPGSSGAPLAYKLIPIDFSAAGRSNSSNNRTRQSFFETFPDLGSSSSNDPTPGPSPFVPNSNTARSQSAASPPVSELPAAGPSRTQPAVRQPVAGPSRSDDNAEAFVPQLFRPTRLLSFPSVNLPHPAQDNRRLGSQDSVVVLNDDVVLSSDDDDHRMDVDNELQRQNSRRLETVGNLLMCNSIYLDFEIEDGEGWELPPVCNCRPMPYDILGNTNLPPPLTVKMMEVSDCTVPQIVEKLKLYGETNISSGCKTRLLLQLKQLLIDQEAIRHDNKLRAARNEPVPSSSRETNSSSVPVSSSTTEHVNNGNRTNGNNSNHGPYGNLPDLQPTPISANSQIIDGGQCSTAGSSTSEIDNNSNSTPATSQAGEQSDLRDVATTAPGPSTSRAPQVAASCINRILNQNRVNPSDDGQEARRTSSTTAGPSTSNSVPSSPVETGLPDSTVAARSSSGAGGSDVAVPGPSSSQSTNQLGPSTSSRRSSPFTPDAAKRRSSSGDANSRARKVLRKSSGAGSSGGKVKRPSRQHALRIMSDDSEDDSSSNECFPVNLGAAQQFVMRQSRLTLNDDPRQRPPPAVNPVPRVRFQEEVEMHFPPRLEDNFEPVQFFMPQENPLRPPPAVNPPPYPRHLEHVEQARLVHLPELPELDADYMRARREIDNRMAAVGDRLRAQERAAREQELATARSRARLDARLEQISEAVRADQERRDRARDRNRVRLVARLEQVRDVAQNFGAVRERDVAHAQEAEYIRMIRERQRIHLEGADPVRPRYRAALQGQPPAAQVLAAPNPANNQQRNPPALTGAPAAVPRVAIVQHNRRRISFQNSTLAPSHTSRVVPSASVQSTTRPQGTTASNTPPVASASSVTRTSSTPSTSTAPEPQAGPSTDNASIECCICMDARKEVLFMPCKHIACCRGCAEGIQLCPICRVPIESSTDVFLA
ncbi:uncharacterized protein LOC132199363 [Neocloeon triangulifer]|uniref:uncharacterized protein LOC132199363 n=1 Tax=Neocloeon triangulifer TaxID=2078957 RepID=UPI00286FA63B|nr:uncharacterized protein LOC132199363 [Neocloeon triangulifer]